MCPYVTLGRVAQNHAPQTHQPTLKLMHRTGKIARLPREIRQTLNERLREGDNGNILVAWLNSLPQVQEILTAQFGGMEIREQNLSEWRKGGYREWEQRERAIEVSVSLGKAEAQRAGKAGEAGEAW